MATRTRNNALMNLLADSRTDLNAVLMDMKVQPPESHEKFMQLISLYIRTQAIGYQFGNAPTEHVGVICFYLADTLEMLSE